MSSTTESVLKINPPFLENSTLAPRKPKSPTQLSYKDLRDRVRCLESDNAQLAGRNQFLEERHAEDRDSVEAVSSKLAAYENAEQILRQAADAQIKEALARFDARSQSAKVRFPDYTSTLEKKPELRQDVLRAVVDMNSGPTVLYFLIKAPEFCKQIQHLPLGAALEQIFIFVQQSEQKLIQENASAKYLALARRK